MTEKEKNELVELCRKLLRSVDRSLSKTVDVEQALGKRGWSYITRMAEILNK